MYSVLVISRGKNIAAIENMKIFRSQAKKNLLDTAIL